VSESNESVPGRPVLDLAADFAMSEVPGHLEMTFKVPLDASGEQIADALVHLAAHVRALSP
jgi:hypothetical protein